MWPGHLDLLLLSSIDSVIILGPSLMIQQSTCVCIDMCALSLERLISLGYLILGDLPPNSQFPCDFLSSAIEVLYIWQ